MKRRTPFTAAGLAALVALVGCTPSAEQASTETSVTTPAPAPAPAPTPGTPAATAPIATPLLARVLAASVPVPATDGRTHLVYELLLTNSMNQDITVDTVVVRPGDGDPLLTLAGAELADRTRVLGTTAPTAELGPSQSALVWLDVITENGRTPTELDHQVQVTLTQPMPPLLPAEVTETVAPVTVQTREPVSIAAPLRGPQWWDANGCCGMTPHRMAINPIDGELWGAERFAIDYVQLMPDGRLFDGKVDDLSGYPYFGAEIHAVAQRDHPLSRLGRQPICRNAETLPRHGLHFIGHRPICGRTRLTPRSPPESPQHHPCHPSRPPRHRPTHATPSAVPDLSLRQPSRDTPRHGPDGSSHAARPGRLGAV